MKNDYSRYNFYIKKENDRSNYFIKVNNQWIEVSKDIYKVCESSYKKIHYENNRDYTKILHYKDIDNALPYSTYQYENNIIEDLYKKYLFNKVKEELSNLSKDEQFIIQSIYFEDMTEKKVADILHISQQSLHYKKQKILKKLKKVLLKVI